MCRVESHILDRTGTPWPLQARLSHSPLIASYIHFREDPSMKLACAMRPDYVGNSELTKPPSQAPCLRLAPHSRPSTKCNFPSIY